MITDSEKSRVYVILSRKIGNIFTASQDEMVFVVERYIKQRTNREAKLDILKGLDINLMYMFPDAGLRQIDLLMKAYGEAEKWFIKNK